MLSTDDVPEFTCAAVRERPLVVKSKKEIVERVCGESSGCRPDMHRRTKVDMCDILRDRIGNFSRGFQNARSHNGRFLRHRFSPKPTSVATPNSLPKRTNVAKEAVSTAWQTNPRQRPTSQGERFSNVEAVALRKNHVVRHYHCRLGVAEESCKVKFTGWTQKASPPS